MTDVTKPRNWLDPLIVVADAEGKELPRRRVLQFIGVRITDDETNDRTVINAALPTIDTADDTPVFVVLATLALHDVVAIDVLVKIASANAAVRQSFKLSGNFFGDTGPAATLDGGSLTDASPRGTGAAVAEFDLAGADVRLKITGIAATDLTTTYELHVL